MQPRGIRLSQAHEYIGVGRKVFDAHIRPHLTLMDWAPQTITVDRLELDAVFEEYKSRIGRPGTGHRRTELWDDHQEDQDSTSVETSGTSTSKSKGMGEFEKALARAKGKKRTRTTTVGLRKSSGK